MIEQKFQAHLKHQNHHQPMKQGQETQPPELQPR